MGVAHPKSMCYLIADEGSACPTSNSGFEMDRAALLFFYLKTKGQKTMATCMLNSLNKLKALENKALGLACSFVRNSISNDNFYFESIKDTYGRLRC